MPTPFVKRQVPNGKTVGEALFGEQDHHPYIKVQVRVDVVTRVPSWAEDLLKVGDKVYRIYDNRVYLMRPGGSVALGSSYSKFNGYQDAPPWIEVIVR